MSVSGRLSNRYNVRNDIVPLKTIMNNLLTIVKSKCPNLMTPHGFSRSVETSLNFVSNIKSTCSTSLFAQTLQVTLWRIEHAVAHKHRVHNGGGNSKSLLLQPVNVGINRGRILFGNLRVTPTKRASIIMRRLKLANMGLWGNL